MNSHPPLIRLGLAMAFATACVALPACGGGSTSTTTSAPESRFTPDTPTPGPGTIALLASSTNGAAVSLRVTVTGVTGFFGTAFRIDYDPDFLLFNGWDTSSSFLQTGNAGDVIFLEDHLTNGGEIVVTATRKDPSAVGPVNVTTTSTLAILNFTARQPIPIGSANGRLNFGDPKQVCDGTVVPPGCGAITVTWSGGAIAAQ